MNTNSFIDSDQGVSPVVGVILMVAIVVILSAITATFVLDLGGSVNENPQAGVTFDYQGDAVSAMVADGGNVDQLTITAPAGATVSSCSGTQTDDSSTTKCVISDVTAGDSASFTSLSNGDTIDVKGTTGEKSALIQTYTVENTVMPSVMTFDTFGQTDVSDGYQFDVSVKNFAGSDYTKRSVSSAWAFSFSGWTDSSDSDSSPYEITTTSETGTLNSLPEGAVINMKDDNGNVVKTHTITGSDSDYDVTYTVDNLDSSYTGVVFVTFTGEGTTSLTPINATAGNSTSFSSLTESRNVAAFMWKDKNSNGKTGAFGSDEYRNEVSGLLGDHDTGSGQTSISGDDDGDGTSTTISISSTQVADSDSAS